jgi:hypothetical protein
LRDTFLTAYSQRILARTNPEIEEYSKEEATDYRQSARTWRAASSMDHCGTRIPPTPVVLDSGLAAPKSAQADFGT